MINTEIASQHGEEAAFLWLLLEEANRVWPFNLTQVLVHCSPPWLARCAWNIPVPSIMSRVAATPAFLA
jgi:hypothetical protein